MLKTARARRHYRSKSVVSGLLLAAAGWLTACSSSGDDSSGAGGISNTSLGGSSGSLPQAGSAPSATAGAGALGGSNVAGESAGGSADGVAGASVEMSGALNVAGGGNTVGGGGSTTSAGAAGAAAGGKGGASPGSGGGGGGAGGLDTDCGQVPVTPNATTATRKVLCYMRSIYGNHILSGQEENNDDNGINAVFQASGKYPAIRAFDANNSKAPSQCVDQWNKGGLCMFGYHMRINGQDYANAQNLTNILKSGTTENSGFNTDLDRYAGMIQTVQDAGGVAIIRLFHEAGTSCHWFWWSKGTPAEWQELHKYAFDYLINKKGLKNMIWIAPLCGSPSADFNPGAKYIDLGGADNYVKAGDYQPLSAMFKQTQAAFPNMMVALHENGSIPDPDQLKSSGTKWLFFNVWSGEYANAPNNPPDHVKAVYNSDYVITRDELPSFK